MTIAATAIQSTRNGASLVVGYREDILAGETLAFSLTSTVGVTSVEWSILGRPEGSVVGGTNCPAVLGTGLTISFAVDADAAPAYLDGSYKIVARINPGSPSETRRTVVVARKTALTVATVAGEVPLRLLSAFEALEDNSLANVLAGWATQVNRWFRWASVRRLRTVAVTGTYAVLFQDDVVLADATGGAFTVTLPSAVTNKWRRVWVKRLNAGGNAVTIAAAAGTPEVTSLSAQNQVRLYVSDGTNWKVVGGYL